MDDETHLLEVAAADREAFVLCLALGTLEAMRRWVLASGGRDLDPEPPRILTASGVGRSRP